ncbi:ABC transporter substrate-binding protein [Paenibacillus sp. IB182496]|uniref:ABC transporter substrate-binding protein n=1 Tax=Paenibacillus sabuli TaxID=2772509 RepID=A0A927BNM4_9BACL|nr:ABC transporter substrate-binding protein [Paenibacillus sabuli]MBD2843867.1 ABC transporter substrate-binding protein [Paenibacillus sabuli]
MFRKKNATLLVTVLMMLALLLAACANDNQVDSVENQMDTEGSVDYNEPNVTLKWVLMGPGEQKDSQKVWAAFNERLQAYLPNTKVEFEVIPAAEYQERWQLMAASREKVDLAWHGWVIPYADEVRRGSYMPLDDLLADHAPELMKEFPDWVWEKSKIDGQIYSVPNFQMMASTPVGLKMPEALLPYMDVENVTEMLGDRTEPLREEQIHILESYLMNLKEAGKLQEGFNPWNFEWIQSTGYSTVANLAVADQDFHVVNLYETDNMRLIYDTASKWYEEGFIRQDILTIDDARKFEGVEGGDVMWMHNYTPFSAESESLSNGFPIAVLPLTTAYTVSSSASGTNMVIPSTSEHPERAIQLLELMNTEKGKELYRMLVWGLEGEHYEVVGENKIQTLDYEGAPDSNSNYGLDKWAVGNTLHGFETQVDPEGYLDYVKEVHEKAVRAPLYGFQMNPEPVRTEIAQIAAVIGEYHEVLRSGGVRNGDQYYEEFLDKLRAAGSERLIEEAQKQIDEWRAENSL